MGKKVYRKRDGAGRPELVACETRLMFAVTMIADINQQPADDQPHFVPISIGDVAYLFKTDVEHGEELWRTDGTTAGTWLVKDINAGRLSSTGVPYSQFAATPDGTIYFPAKTQDGDELWESDGTEAGTFEVEDINPGSASSIPNYVTATPSGVFFLAADPVHGRELWFSDGTTDGAHLVKDLNPGVGGGGGTIAYLDGNAYFGGTDGTPGGDGLWRSSGAVGDVTQVISNTLLRSATNIVAFDHRLYITDGVGGLWTSDGSAAGTKLLVQMNSQTYWRFAVTGQTLFYTTYSTAAGGGFYRIDAGSTISTTIAVSDPIELKVVGSDLYYVQSSGI